MSPTPGTGLLIDAITLSRELESCVEYMFHPTAGLDNAHRITHFRYVIQHETHKKKYQIIVETII